MNVIVDTNIFLDYAFERKNNKYAKKFFIDTLSCKHIIFLPEIILEELSSKNILAEFEKGLFKDLKNKNKLVLIDSNYDLIKESKIISTNRKIPFADVLIAISAKQNDCVIITRDKHLFLDLYDLVDSFKPEELV
ncbi:MAG: PIN domain-containing protein [Candidatus ainarchaeum sp.]|nr:PIN domain-containing protein [Candidatus ainarchaeum sp.]